MQRPTSPPAREPLRCASSPNRSCKKNLNIRMCNRHDHRPHGRSKGLPSAYQARGTVFQSRSCPPAETRMTGAVVKCGHPDPTLSSHSGAAAQAQRLFSALDAQVQTHSAHPQVCTGVPATLLQLSCPRQCITGCLLQGAHAKHLTTDCIDLRCFTAS